MLRLDGTTWLIVALNAAYFAWLIGSGEWWFVVRILVELLK